MSPNALNYVKFVVLVVLPVSSLGSGWGRWFLVAALQQPDKAVLV